jgi:muramoyltetrapeptide carboxypeptidase LdcA involved in peptidoglycan recycling
MSNAPKKLKSGSHIRVVSPARSLDIISEETRQNAKGALGKFGLTVSYGKHAAEIDENLSSSVESRVADLHAAFSDDSVDAILTTIGGFNSGEMLDYIDYDLIKKNPKIICGFSDITALCNAIYAKTGMATYSGPHFSTFGMLKGNEYTIENFEKCLISAVPFELKPADEWSNDEWYLDQENRDFVKNSGFWIMNETNDSEISGHIIGGNLGLLQSLAGTQYFPDIKGSILFLEHCGEDAVWHFVRSLQSLIMHSDFKHVRAIVLGRFEKANDMTRESLQKILDAKPELKNIPLIANVDFGHTTPIITFPIGGKCTLKKTNSGNYSISIDMH